MPDAERSKIYFRWVGWITVAFVAVYPTLNWFTTLRPHRFRLYLPVELNLPFVPELIWAYASMYVLFLVPLFVLPIERMAPLGKQLIAATLLSSVIYLVFPGELGFTRVLPADPLYASLYTFMFTVDWPHNLVPSLHVVFSMAIVLACVEGARPVVRALLYAWLAILTASTVLVHQHHLLDVAAAIPMVLVLRRVYGANGLQVSAGVSTAHNPSRAN